MSIYCHEIDPDGRIVPVMLGCNHQGQTKHFTDSELAAEAWAWTAARALNAAERYPKPDEDYRGHCHTMHRFATHPHAPEGTQS